MGRRPFRLWCGCACHRRGEFGLPIAVGDRSRVPFRLSSSSMRTKTATSQISLLYTPDTGHLAATSSWVKSKATSSRSSRSIKVVVEFACALRSTSAKRAVRHVHSKSPSRSSLKAMRRRANQTDSCILMDRWNVKDGWGDRTGLGGLLLTTKKR